MRMCLSKAVQTFRYVLIIIGLLIGQVNFADQVSISPGDTLSSDVMKDLLKPLRSDLEYEDFLGSWEVTQSVCLGGTVSKDRAGLCASGIDLRDALQVGGSHYQRTDTWQVQLLDREEFPLRISSSKFNFFFNPTLTYIAPNDAISWDCAISSARYLACVGPQNMTYGPNKGCQHDACLLHVVMKIERESGSNLRLTLGPVDTSEVGSSVNFMSLFNELVLSKENTLPIPRILGAEVRETGVFIEWIVPESYTGSFLVLRKSSLKGTFEEIAVTDALNFTDSSVSEGSFWYRIYSSQGDLKSIGSNVRNVTLVN